MASSSGISSPKPGTSKDIEYFGSDSPRPKRRTMKHVSFALPEIIGPKCQKRCYKDHFFPGSNTLIDPKPGCSKDPDSCETWEMQLLEAESTGEKLEPSARQEPCPKYWFDPSDGSVTFPSDKAKFIPAEGYQYIPEKQAVFYPAEKAVFFLDKGIMYCIFEKQPVIEKPDQEDSTDAVAAQIMKIFITGDEGVPGAEGVPGGGSEGVPGGGSEGVPGGVPVEDVEMIPVESIEMVPEAGNKIFPTAGTGESAKKGIEIIPQASTEGDSVDVINLVPVKGTERIPREVLEMYPELFDLFRMFPGASVEADPGEGAEAIPREGAEVVPREGTEVVPREGTEAVPREGAEADAGEGANSDTEEGADSDLGEGTDSDLGEGTDSDSTDEAEITLKSVIVTELVASMEREPEECSKYQQEIFDELVDDAILDVVFQVHRAAKLGYPEEFYTKDRELSLEERIEIQKETYLGEGPEKCLCYCCYKELVPKQFATHLAFCMLGEARRSGRSRKTREPFAIESKAPKDSGRRRRGSGPRKRGTGRGRKSASDPSEETTKSPRGRGRGRGRSGRRKRS